MSIHLRPSLHLLLPLAKIGSDLAAKELVAVLVPAVGSRVCSWFQSGGKVPCMVSIHSDTVYAESPGCQGGRRVPVLEEFTAATRECVLGPKPTCGCCYSAAQPSLMLAVPILLPD